MNTPWPSFEVAMLALGAMAAIAGSPAKADSYPTRPVMILSPAGAGTGPDVIARIVADRLTQAWGQQVLVVNRPGGGGVIAAQAAAAAPPDGHTLYLPLASTFVVLPETQAKMPLDLARDLVPIGMIGEQPMVIAVNPALGINTLAELIARAKGRPGEILFGAPRGTLPHLMGEMLRGRVGLDLAYIPSAGMRAIQDTIGERFMCLSGTWLPWRVRCKAALSRHSPLPRRAGCRIFQTSQRSRKQPWVSGFRGSRLVCLDGALPNAGRHRAKGQSRPAYRSRRARGEAKTRRARHLSSADVACGDRGVHPQRARPLAADREAA